MPRGSMCEGAMESMGWLMGGGEIKLMQPRVERVWAGGIDPLVKC